MTEKEKINIINDSFKNYKINIYVEEKRINYYNSNNNFLCGFYLETNKLHFYYFNDVKKHFKNKYQMYEFITPIIEKIIGRSLNRVI